MQQRLKDQYVLTPYIYQIFQSIHRLPLELYIRLEDDEDDIMISDGNRWKC